MPIPAVLWADIEGIAINILDFEITVVLFMIVHYYKF